MPSSSRAVAYADSHFDARNDGFYDIERAEMFYEKARSLETHPYVHHQLARISFLKGNLYKAKALIDVQINTYGEEVPNSYYVRGLIEGYMGLYEDAALDYERYLQFDPKNWAAINDYAWVLLKAERFADAERALSDGLLYFPNNAWLHNSRAIARFELGNIEAAGNDVRLAYLEFERVSEAQWLTAYPGNDPRIAATGLAAFREAIEKNMHTIEAQLTADGVQ